MKCDNMSVTSFARMDESTREQWMHIAEVTVAAQPRVADRILSMLADLENVTDGFAVNQLEHAIQTATRAEDAGMDEEVIVASLCHDIGKIISVANHPKIAAEILRPYVREDVYWMICALIYSHGQAIDNDHMLIAAMFPGTHWRSIRSALDSLIAKGKVDVFGDKLMVKRCADELQPAASIFSDV